MPKPRATTWPSRVPEPNNYHTADPLRGDAGLTTETRARLFAAENPELAARLADSYRRGQLTTANEVLAELRAASTKANTSRDLRSRTLPAIAAGLLRIWQSEESS